MKKVPCKLCKALIDVSPGLAEMSEHWETWHPKDLEDLRKKLGHDQEID